MSVHPIPPPPPLHPRPRSPRDQAPHHRDEDQHPLSASAVSYRRQERRQDRRWHHAKKTDQSDGSGAAVAERHDAEADGEGPFGRPRGQEAELSPSEIVIAGIARERTHGIAPPAPGTRTLHPATVSSAAPQLLH